MSGHWSALQPPRVPCMASTCITAISGQPVYFHTQTTLLYATICPFSSFLSVQMYSFIALGPKSHEQNSKLVETKLYVTLSANIVFFSNGILQKRENAGYEDVLHGERTIFIKDPTSMERK